MDRECGNACAFLQAWLYAPDIRVQNHVDPDRELLGQRLEEVVEHPVAAIADERLHSVQAVLTFYERQIYRPEWSQRGQPLGQAEALAQTIREASQEGLDPDDYHRGAIEELLES